MKRPKLTNNSVRTAAIISLGLLAAAVVLIGLFLIDKAHRDSQLNTHAQSIGIPPQCKLASEEYISGEFTPMDEILRRNYDCESDDITINQARAFFTSRNFTLQHPMLKNVYVLHENGYYYKVALLASGGNGEPAKSNVSSQSSAFSLTTIKFYTGFHSY